MKVNDLFFQQAYTTSILYRLTSEVYLPVYEENKVFKLKPLFGDIYTGKENEWPINDANYYILEALSKWKKLKKYVLT